MDIKKNDVLFWISVMRDHAIFQSSSLASKEVAYIQKSRMFKEFFETMLNKIKYDEDLREHMCSLIDGLNDFINFKKSIIKGLLTCNLEISLPPSFINHQINEAMEFKLLLTSVQKYKECLDVPTCFTDLLKKWIADASGHAATYASFLDPTEAILREEALQYKVKFDMLSVKANELQLMMARTGVGNGALMLLIKDTIELLKLFIGYLEKILKLRENCMVMAIGTLSPLLPDHMIREHQYVLSKINEFLDDKKI